MKTSHLMHQLLYICFTSLDLEILLSDNLLATIDNRLTPKNLSFQLFWILLLLLHFFLHNFKFFQQFFILNFFLIILLLNILQCTNQTLTLLLLFHLLTPLLYLSLIQTSMINWILLILFSNFDIQQLISINTSLRNNITLSWYLTTLPSP